MTLAQFRVFLSLIVPGGKEDLEISEEPEGREYDVVLQEFVTRSKRIHLHLEYRNVLLSSGESRTADWYFDAADDALLEVRSDAPYLSVSGATAAGLARLVSIESRKRSEVEKAESPRRAALAEGLRGKGWPKDEFDAICEGKIWRGMTEEQLLPSLKMSRPKACLRITDSPDCRIYLDDDSFDTFTVDRRKGTLTDWMLDRYSGRRPTLKAARRQRRYSPGWRGPFL